MGLKQKINDWFEINLPWWLNNLIRYMVGLPFRFVFVIWTILLDIKVIFSNDGCLLNWPWDWDWSWDDD